MGMTEQGQILKLINIAPPTVSLVTTVALVHACYFSSIEAIAHSKAEIFTHPQTELGIYHLESDFDGSLSKSGCSRKLSFSTSSDKADFYLQTTDNKMHVYGPEEAAMLPPLHLLGVHNRHNFLIAIIVARYFGMEWQEIEARQHLLVLPERRLQVIEKSGIIFVNDAYNASELSMKAAMDSIPYPKPGSNRIAVLGGMVELGKFSKQSHRNVGQYALQYFDWMFCFGEECLPILECWQEAGRPVMWTEKRQDLIDSLRAQLSPGDVVLLKGSRLKEVWKVLDELII
jgi:UDP-N-acetylmuramoyl-tripeptide--D-alanyl-D-alanine ligase